MFWTRLGAQSLRFRMLTSYLLLLVLTLLTITLGIIITTGVSEGPSQPTWLQLTALLRGLDWNNLTRNFLRESPGTQETTVEELLTNYAESAGVRVVWFRVTDAEEITFVLDSDENLPLGEPVRSEWLNLKVGAPDMTPATIRNGLEQVYGSFDDHGEEWLFSGYRIIRERIVASRGGFMQTGIIIATPRPTQSLQDVLAAFGVDLFIPLVQASVIGLVLAVILAYFMSRTIAKPLQALSHAAVTIAEGHLDYRAEVEGPQEIRALAEAFNHMAAEVFDTQQSQRDFLANVSHDLKTPLTSIQGYSQALLDGTAKDSARAATIIYDEASRLTRLVNTLTDLARMQAGQFTLTLSHLDVSEVLHAVVHRLEVMADKRHISIKIDAPPMPQIDGDGDRLVQVFNNLVGNAIKYTNEGGMVQVVGKAEADGVRISVKDNGIGIPPKDLPRIFERFYQVDKARGPKRGTGLGLAITYEIVQLHRGTIDVQSVEGMGTQFTVWLPYAQDTTAIRKGLKRPKEN